MEIKETNKLIAEFMVENEGGLIKIRDGVYSTINEYEIPDDDLIVSDLKYHSDWNWLMPVVEKIESLSHRKGRRYYLFMEQSYVQIKVDRMNEEPFGKWGTSSNYDKIGAVYRAVVDFIKHYNQQNK